MTQLEENSFESQRKGSCFFKGEGAFSILVDLKWQEQIKSGDESKRKHEAGVGPENANEKPQ